MDEFFLAGRLPSMADRFPEIAKKYPKEAAEVEDDPTAIDVGTFAAPKAKGKKKGAKGKKNCTKGLSCGASCVKAKKADGSPTVCKQDNPGPGVKAKAKKTKAKKTKSGGGGAGGDAKPVDPVAKEIDPDADAFMVSAISSEGKIKKMVKAGLSEAEARAIATWIGNDDLNGDPKYALMNQAVYAPGTIEPGLRKQIEATNKLAIAGYNKLPGITPEAVAKEAKKKNEEFDPKAPLERHLSIGDPESFIKKYKDSIGKEVSEDTHFATTHILKDFDFAAGANVSYRVAPKWDGTGRGKYIDAFKNSASEGEVLFVPGTKFKVNKVTEPEPKGDPPEIPPIYAAKAQFNAAKALSKNGKDWQSGFKLLYGKKKFDELSSVVKKADTPEKLAALEAAFDKPKNKKAIDDYLKSVRSYNEPARYIIDLQEV